MSQSHFLETTLNGRPIQDLRSAAMETLGHNYVYPDPEERAAMPRWNENETEQDFPMQEAVQGRNSPLNQALDQSNANYNELSAAISELIDRLEPLTVSPSPKPETTGNDVKPAERVQTSKLLKRLRQQDSNIERETRRIRVLLEYLDV